MSETTGREPQWEAVDIEAEEYLRHGEPIFGVAVYIDPLSGERRGFSGKNAREAVQRVRMDLLHRYGVDAVTLEVPE